MTEAEWQAVANPAPMLEFLRGKGSERKLRLFAVACCRRLWESMSDVRSRSMVLVAERFADGLAAAAELQEAYDQARAADSNIYVEGGNQYASTAVLGLQHGLDLYRVTNDVFNCLTVCDERLNAVVHTEALFNDLLVRLEADEWRTQSLLMQDVFGNPFRPVTVDPAWLTSTVLALARQIYDNRDFTAMPVLADALQDAGCDSTDILAHCRGSEPHVRGCHVLDMILGKS